MTHLENAKHYLAIAESVDGDPRKAKKQAYRAAAEEVRAHKDETGDTWTDIAISVGRSTATLKKLDQWRSSGYKADSPFLADAKATTRARTSHAKSALKEPTERKKVIESMTEEEVADVIETVALSRPKAVERAVVNKPKSAAATVIRTAAETDRDRREREAAEKIRRAQERTVQSQPKTTASQYYWRILGQVASWDKGLQWLEDEAHTLKPGERPEVAKRLRTHREAVDSCLAAVEQRKTTEDVIDATAVDGAPEALSA